MPLDCKKQHIRIFGGKIQTCGRFKEFLAEDWRREGELLKDLQDLRRRTQFLR